MRISVGSAVASLPRREPQPGAHAARAPLLIVAGQVEPGHQCPVTMTFAAVPAPGHAAEALEVLGGNGYVEESGMPRLYREAPLNSVWDGSGNVICLDVLRALSRERGTAEAFLAEVSLPPGVELEAIIDRRRPRVGR